MTTTKETDKPLPNDGSINHIGCNIAINQLRARIEELREQNADLQDPEVIALRKQIFLELKKLLPLAVSQAKGRPGRKESKGNRAIAAQPPRPALLRMILRATR